MVVFLGEKCTLSWKFLESESELFSVSLRVKFNSVRLSHCQILRPDQEGGCEGEGGFLGQSLLHHALKFSCLLEAKSKTFS